MDESIQIRLLGSFGVSVGGTEVGAGAWRLRKARSLVKLLALQPDRRLHREQAMQLLWPDRDAASSGHNLRQVVHAARRVLGAGRLIITDQMLMLEGPIRTDVEAFERAAADARAGGDPHGYRAALAAYAGDLLPEDRYEPWSDAPRSELRERHLGLHLELAELLVGTGADAAAIEVLHRALVVDPLHEGAHRAVMRRYEATGRRQRALEHYEEFRRLLRSELEADPDPETRALYRELLAGTDREAAPGTAPPARGPARTLPRGLTSFVGRERELADVERDLGQTRLLTLVGPGGCGKTRLAIAAAERVAPDRTCFIDLGAVGDGAIVAQAVATALGMRAPAQRAMDDAIVAHLGDAELFLLLDTCEHVIDACAALAERLLRDCPNARLLATSREPLRCAGERVWRVPGLAVVGPGKGTHAGGSQPESVQLFVERAATAGFVLDDDSADDVAAICFRLDGMPLAIELAAARVNVLSVRRIAARLEDSFDVLGVGQRTALTRQQTLRATIAWSADLLDEPERALFRRLGVFAGSFAFDAAEEVCAGEPVARHHVLDLLARLVEKSLVVVVDADAPRYRLLDTIRQFAAERLEEAGERDTVEAAHRAWAQKLAAAHDPDTAAGARNRSLPRLELDHGNLRAALASGLRSDPPAALRLAATMWRLWLERDYFVEGSQRLAAALAAEPEQTELRVRALIAVAALALRRGAHDEMLAFGAEAERLARELGDARLLAEVLLMVHFLILGSSREIDAGPSIDEALDLAERNGLEGTRASVLHASALGSFYRGQADESRARIETALAVMEQVHAGDEPFFESVGLGVPVLPEGPGGRLRPVFEDTVYPFRRLPAATARVWALANLGVVARVDGRFDDARAALGEALDRARAAGDVEIEATALVGLGNWARTCGDTEAARMSLERAHDVRAGLGDHRATAMVLLDLARVDAVAGRLGEARAQLGRLRDRFAVADDAPGLGGALLALGVAEECAGELDQAADLLVEGARVWATGCFVSAGAWAQLSAADALYAAGRTAEAEAALEVAVPAMDWCGDARGIALCADHPAHANAALTFHKRSPG